VRELYLLTAKIKIALPLKTRISLNHTYIPSPYCVVNSVIQTSYLMLYSEIIAVCSEIHTKHINTLCGQP